MRARTNVTVDPDLLARSRDAGLNVSAILERGLRAELAARQRAQWLEENADALAEANAFLDRHGLWSDGQRQF